METIEARALRAYPVCNVYNDFAMEYEDINRTAREAYIEGATEQMEIAEEGLWMILQDCLNKRENELIDKAEQWIYNNLTQYFSDESSRMKVLRMFRNDMVADI